MLTQQEFEETIAQYDDLERRGSFYPMFRKLMDHGLEIEAYILMLSTWNFAAFRYVMNNFDLAGFEEKIRRLKPRIEALRGLRFETADFDDFGAEVFGIYQELSAIRGIRWTGAAKLMHLMCPDLFVMWDQYICAAYGFKLREHEEYLEFLKRMRAEFGHLEPVLAKGMAKCIDEYNYVRYSVPGVIAQKEAGLRRKHGRRLTTHVQGEDQE